MKAFFFVSALKAENQILELGVHALSLLEGEANAVDRAIEAVKRVLNGENNEVMYLTPAKVVSEILNELDKMSGDFRAEFIKKTLIALRPKLEKEMQKSRDAFRHDLKMA